MADEIELKLAVAPERAGELRKLELLHRLSEKRGSTRELSTVYFDTPDQALSRRGIALRIRSAGQRKLQTIKLPAEGPGGLQIQREVETPVSGDAPEFDRISDLRLRRLFADAAIADALGPMFVTEFRRTAWPLRFEGSLMALALHDVLPVTLGHATKAARGYALLDGTQPQPVKALPTGMVPTMTARHAFGIAARNCLAQMRDNEASARLGRDPEGVHQLRIGLRRLRALVTAYRDALAPAAHEFLSRELRWLQQELNPARDWDVFIETTLQPILGRVAGLEGCL